MKILIVLFLFIIVGSLFTALYTLVKDRGESDRTVKALTLRVAVSVLLFALLMAGFYFGFIPGRS